MSTSQMFVPGSVLFHWFIQVLNQALSVCLDDEINSYRNPIRLTGLDRNYN